MPSITTHYIHSNEVYKRLNKDIQNDVAKYKHIYNIFAQSHDYFYYSANPNIKIIGKMGHHTNTQDYLMNILDYIKKNNLQEYKPALCYLYGAITHYVLDTICHPYIFYKTGLYRHNKGTKKYKGLHTKMENDINALYYEKYYNKDYRLFDIAKYTIGYQLWDNKLDEIIDYTYLNTYDIQNASILLKKCIKQTRTINRLATKDRFGLKIPFFKLYDKITSNHFYTYSTHHKPNIDYLNLDHKEWNHPCFEDKKYTKSFDDLFEEAIEKAVNIIETAHDTLINNKDYSQITKLITNIDYSTGLDIDHNKRMKYFEF